MIRRPSRVDVSTPFASASSSSGSMILSSAARAGKKTVPRAP